MTWAKSMLDVNSKSLFAQSKDATYQVTCFMVPNMCKSRPQPHFLACV